MNLKSLFYYRKFLLIHCANYLNTVTHEAETVNLKLLMPQTLLGTVLEGFDRYLDDRFSKSSISTTAEKKNSKRFSKETPSKIPKVSALFGKLFNV